MKYLATFILMLCAVTAMAQQQYCHQTNGICFPYPSSIGLQCASGSLINTIPCTTITPTPTPTATPTATPTPKAEPQPAYTINPLFKATDLNYTYVQWMSEMNNVVWGNGGKCCPGIGDGIGECIFSVDYNYEPPRHKEWWCTYRDSTQLWESGLVQVASSDEYSHIAAGVWTYRPAVGALQGGFKDGALWGFGINDMYSSTWQGPRGVGTIQHITGWMFFPQGILDLGGSRWIYANVMIQGQTAGPLVRFYWPKPWQVSYWDPTTMLAPSAPGGSGIVIDADGSLITSPTFCPDGQIEHGQYVMIYRSRDEGRTWTDTGIKFRPGTGKTLFGCGFEHKSGGGAVIPWHLICTQGTGLGPDTSTWDSVDIRVNAAKVPASWGKKPVKWTPQTP